MAFKSKTVLAYSDGFSLPASGTTCFTTAVNTVPTRQAGMYAGLPKIALSASQTTAVADLVDCVGFDAAILFPVVATASEALTMTVYGFWGDAASGDASSRYICQRLLLFTTTYAAGPAMTSPAGTAYTGTGAIALTAATIAGHDLAGPGVTSATNKQDGTATASANATISQITIPYLFGADYLGICMGATTTGPALHNVYVKLVTQSRY